MGEKLTIESVTLILLLRFSILRSNFQINLVGEDFMIKRLLYLLSLALLISCSLQAEGSVSSKIWEKERSRFDSILQSHSETVKQLTLRNGDLKRKLDSLEKVALEATISKSFFDSEITIMTFIFSAILTIVVGLLGVIGWNKARRTDRKLKEMFDKKSAEMEWQLKEQSDKITDLVREQNILDFGICRSFAIATQDDKRPIASFLWTLRLMPKMIQGVNPEQMGMVIRRLEVQLVKMDKEKSIRIEQEVYKEMLEIFSTIETSALDSHRKNGFKEMKLNLLSFKWDIYKVDESVEK